LFFFLILKRISEGTFFVGEERRVVDGIYEMGMTLAMGQAATTQTI
jgi:hypothetical protein